MGGSGTMVFSWLTCDGDSRTGRSRVEPAGVCHGDARRTGRAQGRTSPALHLGGRPPDPALQQRADTAGRAG